MIAPADYEFLSQFLLRTSGLSLGASKDYLLEARLVPLAQSSGLNGLADLVRDVRKNPKSTLATAVIEAMTTNETLFFRDKSPFEDLKERLLPPLLESRSTSRRLRIWSAAASTGQEAYSITMLLLEHFPRVADWSIEIVGTDLSMAALQKAQEGVYSNFEVQRGLPIQLLIKYFNQLSNGWEVRDSLKKWVKFRPLNLLDSFSHLGDFDIIFCRNVLIYFENPVKKQILDRMRDRLRSDGHLILGAAESVLGITNTFERLTQCRAAVYSPCSRVPT